MPLKTYAFSVAIPMKVFLSLSLQNLEVDHLLRCCFTLAGVEVTQSKQDHTTTVSLESV